MEKRQDHVATFFPGDVFSSFCPWALEHRPSAEGALWDERRRRDEVVLQLAVGMIQNRRLSRRPFPSPRISPADLAELA